MLKKEIINILPVELRNVLLIYMNSSKEDDLEEIRLRSGKKVIVIGKSGEKVLEMLINERHIKECMEYISGYSLYAYEEQIKEGFITIRGGHRVGIAGHVVTEGISIKNIKNISSLNIRISHEVYGCSDGIMDKIKGNILIISPPRLGKTTLLRDILRNIGNKKGQAVGIADERGEIAACYMGIPQNDVGLRSDVLDCCPKTQGMRMLLRSMAPTYIGVDELGGGEDIEAVKEVINGGAYIAATIHGESIEKIREKTCYKEIFEKNLFDTYIEIKLVEGIRSIMIYDSNYKMVKKE